MLNGITFPVLASHGLSMYAQDYTDPLTQALVSAKYQLLSRLESDAYLCSRCQYYLSLPIVKMLKDCYQIRLELIEPHRQYR